MINEEKTQLDDQFKDYLKNKGQKLGYLIAASTLSDDIQEELVELLPKFTIEQIDRLINIFEAKYVDEKTKDIDDQFKIKIKEIVDGFKEEKEKITVNFKNNIDEFNKKLEDINK